MVFSSFQLRLYYTHLFTHIKVSNTVTDYVTNLVRQNILYQLIIVLLLHSIKNKSRLTDGLLIGFNDKSGNCLLFRGATTYVHKSAPKNATSREKTRNKKTKAELTLSLRVESQWGCASSILTMLTHPCSAAHINAVDPSSSWAFTSAPASNSISTMSSRPRLDANISAVWPA